MLEFYWWFPCSIEVKTNTGPQLLWEVICLAAACGIQSSRKVASSAFACCLADRDRTKVPYFCLAFGCVIHYTLQVYWYLKIVLWGPQWTHTSWVEAAAGWLFFGVCRHLWLLEVTSSLLARWHIPLAAAAGRLFSFFSVAISSSIFCPHSYGKMTHDLLLESNTHGIRLLIYFPILLRQRLMHWMDLS